MKNIILVISLIANIILGYFLYNKYGLDSDKFLEQLDSLESKHTIINNKKDSVNKEIDTVFVELETIKKVYEKNHNVILNNNTGEDYIFFTEYLRKYSERFDSLDNIRAIKKD